MTLAGIVIARNEERHIARCLESLRFCDEIIVVDSGSTDRTREIASTFTKRVYEREWDGYAGQKNFANGLAESDWILSIDADEEVSPQLRQEIVAVLASGGADVAYSMPRKTMHLGRWIRHGGWYPNRLVRLFRRGRGSWRENELHESWIADGSTGALDADLLHYSFDDLADQIERNNHYSTLGARQLQKAGQRFTLRRLCGKTVSKFFETYLFKRGFLDGYPGFIISVSAAYSVFLKWAKLWELQRAHR